MGCTQSAASDASQSKYRGRGSGRMRIAPLPADAAGGGRAQPGAAYALSPDVKEQRTPDADKLRDAFAEVLAEGSFGTVAPACGNNSLSVDAVTVDVGDAGGCDTTPTSSGAQGKWKRGAVWRGEVWRAVGGRSDVVELRNLFFDGRVVFIEDSMSLLATPWTVVTLAVDKSPHLLQQAGLQRLLHQMLLGVEACHQASVAHRDVKPDNYLICPDGITVKLCDFNACALLPRNQSVVGEFGTAPFMSPEMLMAQHGLGTDVWSYGVMAYFMFFGELPYIPEKISSTAAKAATREGVPVPRFFTLVPTCSSNSMSFCKELLQRDPSQRCSARYAMEHSYFKAAFDAKKALAMPDTQSTLDPFELSPLESGDLESDEDEESPRRCP